MPPFTSGWRCCFRFLLFIYSTCSTSTLGFFFVIIFQILVFAQDNRLQTTSHSVLVDSRGFFFRCSVIFYFGGGDGAKRLHIYYFETYRVFFSKIFPSALNKFFSEVLKYSAGSESETREFLRDSQLSFERFLNQ